MRAFGPANLTLKWTERLVEHLAEKGFDHRYGARPLQRTIERLVVTPLAGYLAENPTVRDMEIECDLGDEGEVTLRVGEKL